MLFRSNDTATTEIYTEENTLSLHDALPISKRVAFVMSAVCPVYPQQQTSPDKVGTSNLCQMQTFDRHQSDARGSSAQALPSAKSSLFHSFENMIARFLRAELSGERPGVKEWP